MVIKNSKVSFQVYPVKKKRIYGRKYGRHSSVPRIADSMFTPNAAKSAISRLQPCSATLTTLLRRGNVSNKKNAQ
jgi:hypothetical protein